MAWNASLKLDYTLRGPLEKSKTVAHFEHVGPLRVLQSLYPEGDAVCHNVLVHPPGGLVGGDTVDIRLTVAPNAHGLVTTPGATRFYRSEGERAVQRTHIKLAANSRMEWLPLETIAYSGCIAENLLTLSLEPGAEMIGWDVTALGLPAASKPFESGSFCQHLELPGVWLERALVSSSDKLLLDSPTGLAGQRCFATLFFASGSLLGKARRQELLDAARDVMGLQEVGSSALAVGLAAKVTAGATSPNGQVVVVRAVAPVVEPAMALVRAVWQRWRSQFWGLNTQAPRIWST